MNIDFLESLPTVWLFIGISALMLAFCELGYQFGARARTGQDSEAPTSIGPMVGALLGMLAFVLAFTFAMASSQHDLRKQNVLEEANAIGTAYLRADLLEKRDALEVKRLLKNYVDIRLQAAKNIDVTNAISQSVEIHKLLWFQVSAAALANPSTNTALMIQATNDVIDMHEKRVTGGLRNRIPFSVWVALAAINALTMIALGTQVGLTKKRRLIAVIPLTLAFSVLVTLVLDLNRPQQGLITVSQESMISLQKSMTL